jgi:hypothetical protein
VKVVAFTFVAFTVVAPIVPAPVISWPFITRLAPKDAPPVRVDKPVTPNVPPSVVAPMPTVSVVLPCRATAWPLLTVRPTKFTRIQLLSVSKPLKVIPPVMVN